LTAAISGGHTIGAAHAENSGFEGTWSDAANQGVFNNDYYKSLILKGWAPKQLDADHTQWERVGSSSGDVSN
jgi:catalase (peroxidase I)